ncbi:MAG: CDP-diacylglycerol--serine O-phosphatidyltransferase [Cellvibrionaceae bacterium]|nr:CDP-diacylglycerol--serine O-phosphatidyltransferase [Cellvibrionaceae bacterium]
MTEPEAQGDQQERADKGIEHLIPVDEHIEEVAEDGKKVTRRGVYLLPNLITTGALFSGFYAIIAGMHHNFEAAAIAIFVAMILDGLDGRVARMTNTASDFGVQYDSLSDMVSFGLAPAMVMFSWGFAGLGKFGWTAAFTYAACAALRLARFNTQVDEVDKRYFVGLASPAAAAIIAGIIWQWHDTQPGKELAIAIALLTIFVGLFMVSNLQYSSFKGIDLRGRVPFVVMLAIVIAFAVVTSAPSTMLLVIFGLYGLSGPALWFWRLMRPVKLGA